MTRTLHGKKRKFAARIKSGILRQGDNPGLSDNPKLLNEREAGGSKLIEEDVTIEARVWSDLRSLVREDDF